MTSRYFISLFKIQQKADPVPVVIFFLQNFRFGCQRPVHIGLLLRRSAHSAPVQISGRIGAAGQAQLRRRTVTDYGKSGLHRTVFHKTVFRRTVFRGLSA